MVGGPRLRLRRLGAAALLAAAVLAAGCSERIPVARSAPPPPTTTTTLPAPTTTTIVSLMSSDVIPTSTQLLALPGPTPISSTAGGPAVSTEPGTIWGGQEVLPVIATNGTWAQVLLPGPPNGATGWVPLSAGTTTQDPWFLQVDLGTQQITAYQGGVAVATSPAATGKPSTPTPVPPGGLTFLTGALATVGKYRVESPALRPLALQVTGAVAASDIATVGGAQVAIHGWEGEQTNPSVWGPTNGLAVSHACVRVPRDFAAGPLTAAPTGTLVRIVSS